MASTPATRKAGSAWVFYNFNIIDEVQVSGLGAVGGVWRLLGRGGQHHHEVRVERATGASSKGASPTRTSRASNITDELLKANPGLGDANVLKKLTDYTVQLGGPISAGQGVLVGERPALLRQLRPGRHAHHAHRGQPAVQRQADVQPDAERLPDRQHPVRQLQPDGAAGLSWRDALDRRADAAARTRPRPCGTSSTARCSTRARSSRPSTPATGATTTSTRSTRSPFVIDNDTGEYFGGAGYYYYADRGRNQVNVSLSKYAEAFGTHNFKFGIEIERSTSHSRSGVHRRAARSAPATSSSTAACRTTPTAA